MPGLNTTARHAMLDATAATWPPDTLSLHTADPGNGAAANAGELSGGSPAYARKALTWAAASGGSKSSNAAVVFDVPGGSTVSHVGYWRGSTFLGSRALGSTESFTGQGTYTIPSGSLTETLS